jgi:hypothetical protein
LAEVYRAVELAQKRIRSPKPVTRPAKNSAQRETPPDPENRFEDLEKQLMPKIGSIALRVVDVFDARSLFLALPLDVQLARDTARFLVKAECENPTAPYVSPEDRRRFQQRPHPDASKAAATLRETVDGQKPVHELWILSEDPAVRDWAKGSRHVIRPTVLSARLRVVPNDYVKAVLVVRLEEPQPTTAPAANP